MSICVQLSHLAKQQKSALLCKSTILQLKKTKTLSGSLHVVLLGPTILEIDCFPLLLKITTFFNLKVTKNCPVGLRGNRSHILEIGLTF